MGAIFYFTFYTDNDNEMDDDDTEETTSRSLAFYVSNIVRPWNELEEDLADAVSELELEYGTHDWSTSPAGVNAVGYYSSEVDVSQHGELMEIYRQEFLKHSPNCVVSAVFEVPNMDNMNDAEILQFTQNAHEQMLAQQQHAVLTENITTPASSVSKKM